MQLLVGLGAPTVSDEHLCRAQACVRLSGIEPICWSTCALRPRSPSRASRAAQNHWFDSSKPRVSHGFRRLVPHPFGDPGKLNDCAWIADHAVPKLGQQLSSSRAGDASASGAPHESQKRALARFSWPQARHFAMAEGYAGPLRAASDDAQAHVPRHSTRNADCRTGIRPSTRWGTLGPRLKAAPSWAARRCLSPTCEQCLTPRATIEP